MEDNWEINESSGKSFTTMEYNAGDNGWDDNLPTTSNDKQELGGSGGGGWDEDLPTTSNDNKESGGDGGVGWDDDWTGDTTSSNVNDYSSNDRRRGGNNDWSGGSDGHRRREGGGGRGGGRGFRGGGGGGGGRRNDDRESGGGGGGVGWGDDWTGDTTSSNVNDYSSNDRRRGGNNDWNGGGDGHRRREGGGGRGGGRGGRGGGGRRNDDRGRGGFQRNSDNYDDSAQSGWGDHNDGDNQDRGFSGGRGGRGNRGGGGGGRGGRRDCDDDNNNGESKPKREFYIPPEPTNDENEIFGSGISSGINFSKYDKIPINISGKDVPSAIKSFEESGLREYLLTNIQKSGYTVPTPVQKNAIPIIMNGRDLMGCAQTGSGKTAAFLLPIINDLLNKNQTVSIGKPQVLILSPTRELAIQIFNEARKFSLGSYLKTCIVYGGPAVKHQQDNVAKGCHILVATPGRLLHFVNLGFITFEDIRFVVLDEADRMLDMGFVSDIEKVMEHPTMPSMDERQTLMFSATFPDDVQRLAGKFLNNYIFSAVGKVGGACSDVEQKFYQVSKFEKRAKLMELLEQGPNGTIVFVETKRNADFLASLLSETKFPTTSIHGDRYQREREMALNDFKSGRMAVLIATSVAARGLDIKNVEHVINYDLPKSIDEYVHRIGRTGRLGNYGKATSFFDPDQDAEIASELVKILEEADQKVPDFLLNCGSGGNGSGRYGGGRSRFGGHDVRKDEFGTIGAEPQPLEPDEVW